MSNESDIRWSAVQTRDASKDNDFVYGVLTTGVYCRPSCASRKPLRRNVRFFATSADAERAGLRPCRRCRPDEARTQGELDPRIRKACDLIVRHAESPLALKQLAVAVGMSPFHFQRRFKASVGLTPKEFHEAERVRSLKTGLKAGRSVTSAIYDAGFGSSSRVYERVDTRLGMTPAQYRGGGRGVAISHATSMTPLGLLMIGATDRGICFIQFGDGEGALLRRLADEYPNATLAPMPKAHAATFAAWMRALGDYLEGAAPSLDLPLDVRGTAFQMRVWRYLQTIPRGHVESYAEVARGIGQPTAARAVAQACASNPVALAIPCHRVIRGNGELGGYRWGVARKRTLLDAERTARETR
ncbi:MAG TPA: bifunctional DNA-binding transcriptional regulator/O6-methylguanine-DNA methyltransferase Ada [Rhodanobacteraceae bacterium]|nr:bifunctional DNA-binding transcriptional regulator/O6-methylguanine-DNA methyltransferase Ada [Rhodanobacteraceae bacterium]